MTHDQLLAALAPPRLPLGMAIVDGREALALASLGCLSGLILFLLIRPLLSRRESWRAQVRQTRGLPAEQRILEVARILGRMPPVLRNAAYGAAPAPDDDAIDAAARRSGPLLTPHGGPARLLARVRAARHRAVVRRKPVGTRSR